MADALRLSPAICVYPDEKCENVTVEVILPGVEKKDISFKISDNGFYVRATKGGFEYADSYAFCCPVEPEKAVADYSNGVLKVTVPYQQPSEKLVDVKIE
jgi:HSP20 family protein